jgi:hypothetical protein
MADNVYTFHGKRIVETFLDKVISNKEVEPDREYITKLTSLYLIRLVRGVMGMTGAKSPFVPEAKELKIYMLNVWLEQLSQNNLEINENTDETVIQEEYNRALEALVFMMILKDLDNEKSNKKAGRPKKKAT